MRKQFAVAIAFTVVAQQGLSIAHDPENTEGDSIPLASVTLASTDTGDAVWAPKIDATTDAIYSFPPLARRSETTKSA